MKYNEIISIKEGYNDVFDMVHEQKDYWKHFVTNKQFEDNLLRIIKVFQSPMLNDHKSVWIQGTYGTGKSHSTSVIKHLLSDPLEEVQEFVNNLSNKQLRSEIQSYRSSKRIFPVVIKGNHGITDASDICFVIQKEVKRAFEKESMSLFVKSDFDKVLEILKRPKFSIFRDELVDKVLFSYLSSSEELYKKLEDEDIDTLKTILHYFKENNISVINDDITSWLKEVKDYIRNNQIANDLVIFWDEFTSLLGITERKAIYSVVQDIAELSKDQNIYIILITHINIEATDINKEISPEEKQHIKDRFLSLNYSIQEDTTYTILYSTLNRLQPYILDSLVNERVTGDLNVADCLEAVANVSSNADESKNKIRGLYPIHPYTAYISTFLAKIIGSSERSIFNFINDKENGFLAFIENDINSVPFLNISLLWDFFLNKFKEYPIYSEIIDVFIKKMDLVKSKGECHFSVFKSILLLNIIQSAAGTEDDSSERTLTAPSAENIRRALSGSYDKEKIQNTLDDLSSDGIIQKTPDNRFEFAISSIPKAKIDSKKEQLRGKFGSIEEIFASIPSSKKEITDVITGNKQYIKRPSKVEIFDVNFKESQLSKLDQDIESKPWTLVFVLVMRIQSASDDQEIIKKIRNCSNNPKYKSVIFLLFENIEFGKQRYESFLDLMAKMEIYKEEYSSDSSQSVDCKRNARKWVDQFVDEVKNKGNVRLFNCGKDIDHSRSIYGSPVPISYGLVPAYVSSNIIPSIYSNGLDKMNLKNTIWNEVKKPNEKTIGFILSSTKEEILKDAKFSDLIKNNAKLCVFDENLEFISSFEETPVSRLCYEVKRIMNEHLNDVDMNISKYFDWMFRSPYGYLMTESSMAAVALAFRPFINKIFFTQTSSSVDALKMIYFIRDLMNFYLNGTVDTPYLHIRFSSPEERELIDKLIEVFALEKNKNDGLLDIKWNIREKFEKDTKAPLWVLKYISKNGNDLRLLIDDLFEFTQKQNEEIKRDLVCKLLEEIEDKSIECINAITEVKQEDCLYTFVKKQLESWNFTEEEIQKCMEMLKSNLSGEVVFWTEKEVIDQIKKYIEAKNSPKYIYNDTASNSSPVYSEGIQDGLGDFSESLANYKNTFIDSLQKPDVSKEQLIRLFEKFLNKRPNYVKELLELLPESE